MFYGICNSMGNTARRFLSSTDINGIEICYSLTRFLFMGNVFLPQQRHGFGPSRHDIMVYNRQIISNNLDW